MLDVGRRLGKLLQARLGADVVYTRKDDTFIPLETRTSIANQEQADLFVSIHANSSRDRDARGVETYYLNFTSSAEALDVAARENAASDKSIHELQDLVKKIALKEKIEESREFASNVQRALHSGLARRVPASAIAGSKRRRSSSSSGPTCLRFWLRFRLSATRATSAGCGLPTIASASPSRSTGEYRSM